MSHFRELHTCSGNQTCSCHNITVIRNKLTVFKVFFICSICFRIKIIIWPDIKSRRKFNCVSVGYCPGSAFKVTAFKCTLKYDTSKLWSLYKLGSTETDTFRNYIYLFYIWRDSNFSTQNTCFICITYINRIKIFYSVSALTVRTFSVNRKWHSG